MSQVLNPSLNGNSLKVAIAVAQFNDFITQNLLSGAESTLRSLGVQPENITVAWVPGAFELPLICKKFANSGRYDAVIALGCVIRGATSHYDLVCAEAAKGIAATSLQTGLPVIFGVITTDTIEQAIERAGTKAGNKGVDAAMAAVQMCSLLTQIEREPAFV